MIRKRSVLVLGAGASMPYHFPSGADLVGQITRGCARETEYVAAQLLACGQDVSNIQAFGEALAEAQPPSIDIFLAANSAWRDIGKLAIAAALMRHERENHLHKTVIGQEDWYSYFFSRILYRDTVDATLSNRFSIVTFNFDRSFEFAFARWLAAAFGLSKDRARDKARQIRVIHVNGTLGDVPWLGGSLRREYEPEVKSEVIVQVAKRLRLVGDEDPHRDVADAVGTMFEDADCVFFLGFGYAEPNIRWLWQHGLLDLANKGRRECYGTFLGCPAGRAKVVGDGYYIKSGGHSCQAILEQRPEFWEA